MARFLWRPFRDFEQAFVEGLTRGVDLAADVYEKDEAVVVEMHVPGIEADKIDISIENQHLYITGSRERTYEVEDRDYYRKEIRHGDFERVIPLPCPVLSDQARAEVKDGTLRVSLPKHTGSSGTKVKVEKK